MALVVVETGRLRARALAHRGQRPGYRKQAVLILHARRIDLNIRVRGSDGRAGQQHSEHLAGNRIRAPHLRLQEEKTFNIRSQGGRDISLGGQCSALDRIGGVEADLDLRTDLRGRRSRMPPKSFRRDLNQTRNPSRLGGRG